jgi:transcription initiation factor TFIIIB Brf1 subunit/transcription initiation factor TFIIB
MDDDREAYEFAYALYLARQVDREAADLIVQAAEAGLMQINEATAVLRQLSRHTSKRHLFG